jgi:deazaflavin-dependent oxidoreductase (nitroreductase family)
MSDDGLKKDEAGNDINAWNEKVMADFRANGGRVGGDFTGVPMVIVHHTGAKSGKVRHAPLCYLPNGDDVVIFGSMGGAPNNPAWYHNLIANPDTMIELGTEIVPVHVREAEGAERNELFERQKKAMPPFADYEAATTRVIPVLVLERR